MGFDTTPAGPEDYDDDADDDAYEDEDGDGGYGPGSYFQHAMAKDD